MKLIRNLLATALYLTAVIMLGLIYTGFAIAHHLKGRTHKLTT